MAVLFEIFCLPWNFIHYNLLICRSNLVSTACFSNITTIILHFVYSLLLKREVEAACLMLNLLSLLV